MLSVSLCRTFNRVAVHKNRKKTCYCHFCNVSTHSEHVPCEAMVSKNLIHPNVHARAWVSEVFCTVWTRDGLANVLVQSPTRCGSSVSTYISLVWGKLRPCGWWRWKEGYFWMLDIKFQHPKTKAFVWQAYKWVCLFWTNPMQSSASMPPGVKLFSEAQKSCAKQTTLSRRLGSSWRWEEASDMFLPI